LDSEGYERAERHLQWARDVLRGRTLTGITFQPGGGLIELQSSVLTYLRDGGVDAHWLLLTTADGFSPIARRLYNNLYGSAGDGKGLTPKDREVFERTVSRALTDGVACIRPGDLVFLHDPPTAPLVGPVQEAGAHAVWCCNLGLDTPNDQARNARDFLLPFVEPADAYVFTRRECAWAGLAPDKVSVIAPSIDPLSPKNQELSPDRVEAILDQIGLTDTGSLVPPPTRATTVRRAEWTVLRRSTKTLPYRAQHH